MRTRSYFQAKGGGFTFLVEPYDPWILRAARVALREAGLEDGGDDALRASLSSGHILVMRKRHDRAVGGAHFRLQRRMYADMLVAEVTGLYLLPEWRRGRNGIWLLDMAVGACWTMYPQISAVTFGVRWGGPLDRLLPRLGYSCKTVRYELELTDDRERA